MLSFGRAPGVVQFEALIAVASFAVHATLGGLLLRRLTDVAHDGDGCPGGLAIPLHNALQGEVAEEHADAALTKVDVMLAAGARDGGDPGSHGPSAPSWGGNGAWRRARDKCEKMACNEDSQPSIIQFPILRPYS